MIVRATVSCFFDSHSTSVCPKLCVSLSSRFFDQYHPLHIPRFFSVIHIVHSPLWPCGHFSFGLFDDCWSVSWWCWSTSWRRFCRFCSSESSSSLLFLSHRNSGSLWETIGDLFAFFCEGLGLIHSVAARNFLVGHVRWRFLYWFLVAHKFDRRPRSWLFCCASLQISGMTIVLLRHFRMRLIVLKRRRCSTSWFLLVCKFLSFRRGYSPWIISLELAGLSGMTIDGRYSWHGICDCSYVGLHKGTLRIRSNDCSDLFTCT